MILVDANLLIYAHSKRSPFHEAARSWLDFRLSNLPTVGLPWPALLAFVRIVSNPRIVEFPESVSNAWQQVQEWLASRSAWIPQPTEQHREVLGQLLRANGISAKLVPDAHLAALAIEHRLTLRSTDGDFARFRGLGEPAPRRSFLSRRRPDGSIIYWMI